MHSHSRCNRSESTTPKPAETKPPKTSEQGGIDEEDLALMGATFLVAGASYLLGRWRKHRAQKA